MLTLVMLCETGCTSWDIGRCNCAGCVLGPAELSAGVTAVVWRWGLMLGYAGPTLYGPGPSEPSGPRLLWDIWKIKYVYRILTTPNSYFTIETASSTPTTEFNMYDTWQALPFLYVKVLLMHSPRSRLLEQFTCKLWHRNLKLCT